MTHKILTLLLFFVGFAAQGVAQAEKKAEINKIKKSDSYIYAEATLATPEEAAAFAEELLYHEINKWVATQKKLKNAENIVIKDSKLAQQSIALPRGNMFRAFFYVKKSDIMAADNTTIIRQQGEGAASTGNTVTVIDNAVPAPMQLSEPLKTIVAAQKFTELRSIITRFKAEGSVTAYDLYTNLSDASEYYLIVSDRQQQIVAVLAPGGDSRLNLKTNKPDAVSNYAWHGATIAFKLK